jgi:hypothetical protein
VLKIKRGDIAVCKAAILDKFQRRYQALYDYGSSKYIYESVALQQESVVGNLPQKRGVVARGSALSPSSVNPFSSALTGMSTSSSVRGSKHNSFAFSSQRTMLMMNMDIWKSNNATVEMAIANFSHCKNIPDSVVELPRSIQLVRVCRLVREDIVVPHQKQIGGMFLDLNYANVYKRNKAELLKFAKVFRLTFPGDGATIH